MSKKRTQPKIHPVSVPGFGGSNHELGAAIGKMRYDQIVSVLEGLRSEIQVQAEKDGARKRYQLMANLMMMPALIGKLIDAFEKVFWICEPHMKDELEKVPARKAQKRAVVTDGE